MILDPKPYPTMKDSGLPWVGEVPEHWSLVPNRALMRRRKVLVGKRHTEYRLLSLTKEGIIIRDAESGKGKFSADMGTCQEVRSGDLVFCLFDVPETPRTIGLSRHNGMITGAYTVFECSDPVVSAFLELFYRAMDDRKLLSPLYSGLRNTIPPTRFLGIKTPVPPHDEQSAIVHFLDYIEGRIRRYIRAKQKIIKLLEAQKQVIIHRAVTRGLDPNVRLKPSGVEWLGDVPEHWVVWHIGHFSRVGNGSTPSRGNSAYWNGGHYPWLNSASANREVITQADQFVTGIALRECHLPIVPPSSVLVAITGQGKTRGKAAALRIEATINQHVAFIIPRANIASADYLRLALHGAYNQLRAISDDSGSTKGALTCADLKHFSLALPPISEQGVILEKVRDKTRTISTAIDYANREISLLREYRTRLISDVVTGKLDVRDIELPAADAEATEECSDLPDIETYLEDQEMEEEIPAEGD
jgi:type I restriction enzyme S subunit